MPIVRSANQIGPVILGAVNLPTDGHNESNRLFSVVLNRPFVPWTEQGVSNSLPVSKYVIPFCGI